MRITHNYQARMFSANNQSTMNRISDLQNQIASAKRVLDPADDPAATSKSILVQQSIGQLAQYERNGTYAESRLSMEESAVASISNVITSLRELALQANNDALGDQDRQTLQQSAISLQNELRALVNSRGPNGEYLFSGTLRDVKPYPDPATDQYAGNNSSQLVNIGLNNQIALGTSGAALTNFDISGSSKSLFTTISDLETTLGTPVTVPGRGIFHDQMAVIVEELDHAQNSVIAHRAQIGDRLARIDTASSSNGSMELLLTAELDTAEGLDYADAISRLESEIQSLEAIQSTYARIKDLSLFNYI